MKKLTLVVGAGASSEFNLPLGTTLKTQIVSALRQRDSGGNVADQDLYYAMSELARSDPASPVDMTPYIRAVEHINDSLCQSLSIDNFINSHLGDRRIEVCGKLAIAKCILDAERNSYLSVDSKADPRRRQKIDFNLVDDTWLNSFFKVINQDCSFANLKARLENIAIVIFNYDRCVEQFLLNSITNFYRVSKERAAEALNALEVHHPYGSLGAISGEDSIPFGHKSDAATLLKSIAGIRTFSESASDQKQTQRIKELVARSNTLLFLGFGFIPLNMRLLSAGNAAFEPNHGASIFATTLGISAYDKQRISSELQRLANSLVVTPQLTDSTAASIFTEFTRGITFG